MVGHCEAITVKVCLYPGISWGKPTFAEFRITSITSVLGYTPNYLPLKKANTAKGIVLISTRKNNNEF